MTRCSILLVAALALAASAAVRGCGDAVAGAAIVKPTDKGTGADTAATDAAATAAPPPVDPTEPTEPAEPAVPAKPAPEEPAHADDAAAEKLPEKRPEKLPPAHLVASTVDPATGFRTDTFVKRLGSLTPGGVSTRGGGARRAASRARRPTSPSSSCA